jgi:murein L,D-transpeptidase YcbB/YkuD
MSLSMSSFVSPRMLAACLALALVPAGAAVAQSPSHGGTPHPASPTGSHPGNHAGNHADAAKKPAAAPASTPEQRSAEALALSSLPVFDAGTAQRIRQAALSYEDIAVRGGWPAVPAEGSYAPGADGPHVDLLRQRLLMSGDLETEAKGAVDAALTEALKRFQHRHGLAPTGTMTPRTLAALNVPVKKRVQQLEASLERLGAMHFGFGERYVVVNIPSAYAEAVQGDKVVRRYRVVVGKTEKPSPTLTAEINQVVINPTWTVPPSIIRNEIAAHMRRDPSYLTRMQMQVLDSHDRLLDPASVNWSADHAPNFSVRQASGSHNALGFVKIDMPNPYSVYMHDTTKRSLFAADYRFDSHGCSRVDNVRDLAAWLLEPQGGWPRSRIDSEIDSGRHLEVPLASKVPVAWVYLTGWMTRDEVIHFRNDVYAEDTHLLEAAAEEAAFAGDPRVLHLTRAD